MKAKPKTRRRAASKRGPRGGQAAACPPEAAPEGKAAQEAKHFERTLRANRQVGKGPGPLPPGATHAEETDEQGRTQIRRKRFSAV